VGPSDRQNFPGDRFGNWTSSPEGTDPRNPNSPVPPPEPGRPLGIFTGKPMPLWTTPLPLGELLGNPKAAGNNDRFVPPGGLFRDGGTSRAPSIDAGVLASPIGASGRPNFSGGFADWIAALAGVDPQNPDQPARSPFDDQLRRFYRDDPAWLLAVRR
jgi:hypothetical protein